MKNVSKADVVLIGAGIMNATLGMLLKQEQGLGLEMPVEDHS